MTKTAIIKYLFTIKDLPHNITPSEYEAEIEWFNEDKRISFLYSLIDNKILHRCSLQDFSSIVESKFIYPNKGQFNFSYPQSQTNIGGQNNWISLFNFNKTPFQIMKTYCDWRKFLTDKAPITILIIFKNEFEQSIIKNPFCGNNSLTDYRCIAYVEEWCEAPISVQNFETILFVPNNQPNQYISCSWENVQKCF